MYNDAGINKKEFLEYTEDFASRIEAMSNETRANASVMKDLDPYLEGKFIVVEAILKSALSVVQHIIERV